MSKRVKSLVMVVIMMFSIVFVPEMQVAAKKPEKNFKLTIHVGDTREINVKSIKQLEKNKGWKLSKVTTSNKKTVAILRKNKKVAIMKGKRTGKAKITVYLKNKKKQTKKVVYQVTVKAKLKIIKVRAKIKRKISKYAVTLHVGDMRQINVKPVSLLKKGWKLSKVTTSNKKTVAILRKNKKAGTVDIKAKRVGKAKITLYLKSNKPKKSKTKKIICTITVKPKKVSNSIVPTNPTEPAKPTEDENQKRFNTSKWKFDNLEFTYDKSGHLPKLLNVPKEVTPTYSLDPQINAGSYKLTVKFEVPEGYEAVPDMETDFVIKKADPDISGIAFKNKEVTFTPKGSYSIYATNLSDELEIDHYEVNGKIEALDYFVTYPGIYNVKVFFKVKDLQNYNEVAPSMEATLTVKEASFNTSNWKFDNLVFTYDKLEHLPKLLNVPKEVLPIYSLEPQIKAGNYKLTVNFAVPEGYEAIPDMETNFIIKKADPDVSKITFEYEGEEVTTKGADGSPIVSMLFNADSEDFYNLIKCKEASIPEELLFNHYIVDGQEQAEDYLITTPGKHVIEAVFKPKDPENYNEVKIKTVLDLRYAFDLSLDAKEDGEGHLAINIGVANIDKQGLGLTDMAFTLSGIEGLSYQDMEIYNDWQLNENIFYNPAAGTLLISPPFDESNDDLTYITQDTIFCKLIFDIGGEDSNINISMDVDSANYVLNNVEYDMINCVAKKTSTVVRPSTKK